MALTFFQKLQVAFRGWSRRREDDAKKRDAEFLKRNASWSGGQAPSPVVSQQQTGQAKTPVLQIDYEGLQVAYLDDSGQIGYFLDVQTGEVVEMRGTADPTVMGNPARYKRVPQRGADIDDRRAFIDSLDPSPLRDSLGAHVATVEFRRILASDRAAERAWYNFRNQRATSAIGQWIRSLGMR
jgi:hypothetical protein